jgi:hypothetical protein
MMNRIVILLAVGAVGVVLLSATDASADCRSKAASKAASVYSSAATAFRRCSDAVAKSGFCTTSLRDAKVQTKLAATQTALLRACTDATAAFFGFGTNDALATRVAGVATGEGRQVIDSLYGRDPVPLSQSTYKCASMIAKQSASAGKKLISTLMKCGTVCSAADQAKVDQAFTRAKDRINARCSAADIAFLVTDLDTHLDTIRAGAQRVVNSLSPGPNPLASVVSPLPGTIITPPSLPAQIPVVASVASVPHAGYVISVDVNGAASTYNSNTERFEHTVQVNTPNQANYPIFLKARTYLGVFTNSTNVKFNLGNLAPDVVITGPTSGTITNS